MRAALSDRLLTSPTKRRPSLALGKLRKAVASSNSNNSCKGASSSINTPSLSLLSFKGFSNNNFYTSPLVATPYTPLAAST